MVQKIVGVLQTFAAPTRLDILFFDRLITLEDHLHHMRGDPKDDNLIANFDYLKSIGFIDERDITFKDLLAESEHKGIEASPFAKRYARLEFSSKQKPHWTRGCMPSDARVAAAVSASREYRMLVESGMKARLFSLTRSSSTEAYTPILRYKDEDSEEHRARELLQVVVNAFPVPADSVSYEEIFHFKNDSSVQRNHEIFKRWLRVKLRDESANAERLCEELADLLSDYREYMRLANLKVRDARLNTLYSAPLATVERLIKLEFSKLLEPIFELRKYRMEILEAEAKSPGREVAYLHKATERFGGT